MSWIRRQFLIIEDQGPGDGDDDDNENDCVAEDDDDDDGRIDKDDGADDDADDAGWSAKVMMTMTMGTMPVCGRLLG